MDSLLKLGEDVELGYRLAQVGAVFVPDDDARSWHLGRTTLMQQQDAVNRYNRPFVTDRVPDLRHWRTKGRAYSVPWVTAVVDAREQDASRRCSTRSTRCSPPRRRHRGVSGRRRGTGSATSAARRWGTRTASCGMLQAEYVGEGRVRLVEEVPGSAFPAPYRLLLPAGWAPGRDAVARLAREMATAGPGAARRCCCPTARSPGSSAPRRSPAPLAWSHAGEDLDDAVDAVSGTWWFDGVEEGFTWVDDASEVAEAPDSKVPRRPKDRGAPSRDSLSPEDEHVAASEKPKWSLRRRLTGG